MSRDMQESVSYSTIRRLPLYMPLLKAGLDAGDQSISSAKIAEMLFLDPVLVRKDLSSIGITGQARLGFPIRQLIEAIEQFLGWDNASEAFVIGAGNLGAALAGYPGFEQHGLKIVGLFDVDPERIGKTIAGKPVLDMQKFTDLVQRMHIHIAILTVPSLTAEAVANQAVQAGIRAIWNFTPVKLSLPEDIIVERVDLAASLAVLSRKLTAKRSVESQHLQG